MKYLGFAAGTFAYGMVVCLAWLFIRIGCDWDDAPACAEADSTATIFVGVALIVYGCVLTFFLQRYPPFGDS